MVIIVVMPIVRIPNGWNSSSFIKPEERPISIEYVNSDKTLGTVINFERMKDATLHYTKNGIEFTAYRFRDDYSTRWEYVKPRY